MDYANRKRPPKRPPIKKKPAAKKASAQRAVPWRIVVLALVLVGLFVWGLVTIAGKRHQQPAVSPSQPEPVPATVPQSINELPELPQERWEYIDELENQEVIVDVPEREVGPPKVMQCGSFRQLADAERLRAQIAMAGLESQVRTTEGQTGTWHRVILGPYATKREAEAERHKLERARIHNCMIWNWE
ncbi:MULTISPECIES: SPOR domain-containing protein [Pseudidiomarina]|uniref:Cell division protein FtsN n=2 Tax=Pseudidiomarina TaxID=2800384 RepID=A0A368UJX9_9GAMM|nr:MULTISPECIES: SPOR domain-containing protein [Pseudidiomarina]PWW07559.1 cell division protein FtsN [Pseudidiomarina maritima]RBP86740.1 cell division protein FtsN [Pseudidiomarina tainanensis]RCW28929.1 cell division protein FtsN [Pseudidiomarina tainanensis]